MANEFKVKNGIKFPDNTIQTTAATGGGGGATLTVSDTPPGSPSANNSFWWDSTIGQLRLFYNDGDTSQWVDAVNTQGIPGINGTNGTNGTNGLGVPAGGTIGQALVKLSATNNDTAWATVGGVTSVAGTGTVSGLTLTGTVTTSGNLTLGGTLAVAASNFAAQTANTVLASPNNAAGVPTFRNLTLEDLPDAWVKRAVKCATTANITLSGTQTIDGVSAIAGDRVLVKNQSTTSANGIYIVAAGSWTRALDADTASELAGAMVAVDQGTVNGGKTYDCDFRSTDTVGTTALTWNRILDDSVADFFYRRNSDITLDSNTTNSQSWLGLSNGVTVQANTVYEFEGYFHLSTSGTNSHAVRLGFGLTTATVSAIAYTGLRFSGINSTATTSPSAVRVTATSQTQISPGGITSSQTALFQVKGTVVFGTGGQFNPQMSFTTSPGGTSTVFAGSFFRMTPLGTSGSNLSNGTWS